MKEGERQRAVKAVSDVTTLYQNIKTKCRRIRDMANDDVMIIWLMMTTMTTMLAMLAMMNM